MKNRIDQRHVRRVPALANASGLSAASRRLRGLNAQIQTLRSAVESVNAFVVPRMARCTLRRMQDSIGQPPRSFPGGRQPNQAVGDLFVLVAQETGCNDSSLTHAKVSAGQRNADTVFAPQLSRPDPDAGLAGSLFSRASSVNSGLHAHLGIQSS